MLMAKIMCMHNHAHRHTQTYSVCVFFPALLSVCQCVCVCAGISLAGGHELKERTCMQFYSCLCVWLCLTASLFNNMVPCVCVFVCASECAISVFRDIYICVCVGCWSVWHLILLTTSQCRLDPWEYFQSIFQYNTHNPPQPKIGSVNRRCNKQGILSGWGDIWRLTRCVCLCVCSVLLNDFLQMVLFSLSPSLACVCVCTQEPRVVA